MTTIINLVDSLWLKCDVFWTELTELNGSKASFVLEVHIVFSFFLKWSSVEMERVIQPVVSVSLAHLGTLALSQSVMLTLYQKQAVCAGTVYYVQHLNIRLFLSVSRGTWQSTLWLWTSTTCSNSMPVCCTKGASSLPQASSALWVHSHLILSAAVTMFDLLGTDLKWLFHLLSFWKNHS